MSYKGFHMSLQQRNIKAQQSACSVHTDRDPTRAELENGGYDKGEISFKGIPINIENPIGSTRSGDGWSITFTAHYGEIIGVIGADGDPVDVFVCGKNTSERVFVLNAAEYDNPKQFAQHKVMLGCSSIDEALKVWEDHNDGPAPLISYEICSLKQLKAWLTLGDKLKPFPTRDDYAFKFLSMDVRKNPEKY